MSKQNSVCRLCRQAGAKLFLKGERCYSPKCPFTRRPYRPGVVGPKSKMYRVTDFGKQLLEKQKLCFLYDLSETGLRNYFKKAGRRKEPTGEVLLQLLERRLDNLIYRLGVASSRREARQLVSHGLVKVNRKKINIPSYLVKKGDKIEIGLIKHKTLLRVEIPKWLKFDKQKMLASIEKLPEPSDIKEDINIQLIVEYYSR